MKSSNSWQDNHSQGACNTLDLLQAVQKDKMRRRRQEREREREREGERFYWEQFPSRGVLGAASNVTLDATRCMAARHVLTN